MPNSRLVVTSGLVGATFFVLCIVVAIFLFRQQSSVADLRDGSVLLWRESEDLEECLTDLAILLDHQIESVEPLNRRFEQHLDSLRRLVSTPEEAALVLPMEVSFARYREHLQALDASLPDEHREHINQAASLIAGEWSEQCRQLRDMAQSRLADAAQQQRLVLQELAWGLVFLGSLGGIGGILLGFALARSLERSVRRLQFHLRDAAGKLGPDLPAIVVSDEGNLNRLHTQVEDLIGRIERTVTELQQREREVIRAEQLASLGQLAAGIAHEMRNPLTGIKLLVQSGVEDGSLAGESLSVIETEIRRMERSLQGFMDLARPPKAERKPVEVDAWLLATLQLIRARAQRQHVRVVMEPAVSSLWILGDGAHLRQVLLNLLLNALDAMPRGGTLRVTAGTTHEQMVRVTVADTGPGLSAPVRARLFEPFFSTKETGLGLGLVISKRIIEDHDGTLDVGQNAEGHTEFRILLPAFQPRENGSLPCPRPF